ncbi:hypothetical protein [Anaerobaca lacustris]|uniref:Uncharacterized protein n=1 Tax=Anaerobaca lacustris TaxID=3044600 RepID=A0AAW6U0S9_9BACT|nr:hypothetical protein [Sedimentisphaerales bacterium M17dextr]
MWTERVRSALQPLSVEKHAVGRMLREWYYTGSTYDLEEPVEDCELCGHQGIRYQFEIENSHTGHSLLVGSECITKFDITAVDEAGELLDADETRHRVRKDRRKLITDARRRRVINALVQLAHADTEFEIESFIDYFQDRDAYTPNQLSLLVWRLKKHRIKYRESDLKMIIRRDREKNQLRSMADWKVRQIWPCMSASQKAWYIDNVGPVR